MAFSLLGFRDTALYSSYGVSNFNVVADVFLFLFLSSSRRHGLTSTRPLPSSDLERLLPLLKNQTHLTEIHNIKADFQVPETKNKKLCFE